MTKRSAFTMVEMLVTTALTAIVVGTVTLLYSHSTQRASHSIAATNTIAQVQALDRELKSVISQAVSCQTVTSGGRKALKCTMPQNGTDSDNDGLTDAYTPSGVSRRGIAKWGTGKRIWFYQADTNGNFSVAGTYLWRVERNDDATPNSVTATDKSWTVYYDTKTLRWNLISNITFTVDSAKQTVTYVIDASQLIRDERVATDPSGADSTSSRSSKLTRTVYWRNWRR